ncbi:hypothetical protein BCR33DRAFT_356553 [Rhizoclosmatium globosum]|uniref:Uncharacterized protein n=1 Tax=Rhizoclosmatium globosum TaxID=329046 RepID=A0A1Y2C2Z5_9FUNG|nr:hypothetical protein BCR33DRAFT_356553 [Rhizoclosmatium globosum]|eukprot:ORY40685.1 hypothetical protein BCR33DRAFT_356553 [Rhizoclosmatium globosum]
MSQNFRTGQPTRTGPTPPTQSHLNHQLQSIQSTYDECSISHPTHGEAPVLNYSLFQCHPSDSYVLVQPLTHRFQLELYTNAKIAMSSFVLPFLSSVIEGASSIHTTHHCSNYAILRI